MSTYAISDLHGYPLVALQKLLATAAFGAEDTLYVLGDVIDRNGDGGIAMLRWMMERPNVLFIRGNHEQMMLECRYILDEISDDFLIGFTEDMLQSLQRWTANGGDVTMDNLARLSDEQKAAIFDYLEDTPLYEAVTVGDRDFVLTHAGLGNFRADKKLSEYTPMELLWARPMPDDRYFENGVTTVFGHTPTIYYGREYRGCVMKTDTWMDIDTGAADGHQPTLLRLDDLRTFPE